MNTICLDCLENDPRRGFASLFMWGGGDRDCPRCRIPFSNILFASALVTVCASGLAGLTKQVLGWLSDRRRERIIAAIFL